MEILAVLKAWAEVSASPFITGILEVVNKDHRLKTEINYFKHN